MKKNRNWVSEDASRECEKLPPLKRAGCSEWSGRGGPSKNPYKKPGKLSLRLVKSAGLRCRAVCLSGQERVVGAVKRAAARRSVAEARFLLILKTEMFAAGSKIGTSFDANAERQGFNHSKMLICGGLITKLLAGPQGCAVVFPLGVELPGPTSWSGRLAHARDLVGKKRGCRFGGASGQAR